MSNEIKDMIVDKGVEKVINLANETIKGVLVRNEEHKKMIKNRDAEEKQREEELKEAREYLDSLYEKMSKKPEIDLSEEISLATKIHDHKKKMYDDHVEETTNLNKKEASDPERNSIDTILGIGLSGALGGLVCAITTHYLKDNAKNLKIK